MPTADFNKNLNLPSGGGRYVKLSKKGDKIKFRIATTPHYETKHFLGDKEFSLCGKYNSEDPKTTCKYCQDYALALENNDEVVAKQLKPMTTFYYPVLDINEGKAKIFQFTAKSIHYTIKGYADEGVDVFACDWSVERTEEQGANYYKVLRLDATELTKEQEEELNKAKAFKFDQKASDSISEEDMDEIDKKV